MPNTSFADFSLRFATDERKCILARERRPVRLSPYKQLLLNVWFCLLAYCLTNCLLSIVVGDIGKLLVVLLVGGLLLFVVIHSSHLRRIAAAIIRSILLFVVAPVVHRSFTWVTPVEVDASEESSHSPLFQRPPPILSF